MKTELVQIRMTKLLKEQSEHLASKRGKNLSELIRYLLEREVEKEKEC